MAEDFRISDEMIGNRVRQGLREFHGRGPPFTTTDQSSSEKQLKDFQPKEVEIHRGIKTAICDCSEEIYNQDNYCAGCGAKIKWIA